MNIKLILLFLLPLLLFGCRGDTALPEPAAPAAEQAIVGNGVILIPVGCDPLVERAADSLAQMLSDTLGAEYTVAYSENPMQEMYLGGASMILAPNDDWSRTLDLLSNPFLFTGYEHFSMSMNSLTVIERLNSALLTNEATALAAYYTGASFLVDSINLDDYRSLRGMVIDAEDEAIPDTIPKVAMRDKNAPRRAAYEQAGAIVTVITDAALRFNMLMEDQIQVAEFTFNERPGFGSGPLERFFLTRSWQDIGCVWLAADSEWLASLTEPQEARLREAMSSLFAAIDREYLEREREIILQLSDLSFRESIDFTRTRRMLRQNAWVAFPSPDVEQRRILSYIENIGG